MLFVVSAGRVKLSANSSGGDGIGSPHTYCRAPNPVPVDETAEPETVGTFDDYLRADSFDSLRGAFFCKTATR